MITVPQDDIPVNSDQTRFTTEEPLFESRYVPTDPHPQPAPPSKVQQYRWWLIGGGILSGLVIMVTVTVLMRQPEVVPKIIQATPQPVTSAEMKPFERELQTLKSELRSADPAKQELPFPAVNLTLSLEDS
jgi:hypothetical protein